MTVEDEIRSMLEAGSNIDVERLRALRQKYPYFVLPASLSLENPDISEEEKKEILRQIAINTSDKEIVANYLDSEKKYEDFYPEEEEKEEITTEDAISTFITNYGVDDPHEEEVLMQLIFNPTPDYAQILAREEENNIPSQPQTDDGEQDKLINEFIIKSKEQGGHYPIEKKVETEIPDSTPISEPEEEDSSLLTESLAKSYIKQKKYCKALEIITRLSLNFPQKSIYFADQIRFLKKIILIEQSKKVTNN